jgi:hypothetical protein
MQGQQLNTPSKKVLNGPHFKLQHLITSKMNKPKLYISGPISNMPDLNRTAFNSITKKFRDLGYIVVNPHELCNDLNPEDWKTCMKRCIVAMMDCDQLIMIDGWRKSAGATIEYQLAVKIGIDATNLDLFLKSIS